MITRNLKNIIFCVFAIVQLTPLGKATEQLKINPRKNIQIYKHSFYRNFNDKTLLIKSNHIPILLASNINSQNELEIQSDIQSEENNILNAKGNVLVNYKDSILQADSLKYDKKNKIISGNGNVTLNIGEQIFKMDSFEYDFNNKRGFLFEVKGLIRTDNLIDDLFSNFDTSDNQNIEFLEQFNKDKVLHTPNKINNWFFYTKKIEIDGDKWKSQKAIFTNDLLELNQIKININSLVASLRKEELRFKSSLNYLILDEKISIPFWIGDRTLTKSGEKFTFANRWNFGFDNVDRDGYFIGRKFNTIDLFNDFKLDLEPQFLFQRSLKGHTKSFVDKGDSITGNKVKRDTTFVDYFALNSKFKGKINNWDLLINKQIYSFDADKFSDALRMRSNLNKEFTFLNSKWNKSFYGIYRDRVWNGSLGEAEIYIGFGSKLEKENTWEVDGITKTEILSLGLAKFKGEALNSKNLVTSFKGNFFYSLDQKFPISIDKPSNKFVDSSYKYIFEPISKGLSLNTKMSLLYSFYEGGNTQEYLGFGAGPELIFGNFKNKYFDYSRISVLPFYRIKSGDSMFKFDQISDKFTLDIAFDQQLIGPIILKSSATLNLDSNSKDYGDFINSKISLNLKKRSYEFGLFYQPHNEAGGISFNLFGFK